MQFKTNYRIHTDSIKENLIPSLTEKQYAYANEADMLNVALFGMTAKEWKDKNPNLDGNMRERKEYLKKLKNRKISIIKQKSFIVEIFFRSIKIPKIAIFSIKQGVVKKTKNTFTKNGKTSYKYY